MNLATKAKIAAELAHEDRAKPRAEPGFVRKKPLPNYVPRRGDYGDELRDEKNEPRKVHAK